MTENEQEQPRYHIGKGNVARRCQARKNPCRLTHFSSMAEAKEEANFLNELELKRLAEEEEHKFSKSSTPVDASESYLATESLKVAVNELPIMGFVHTSPFDVEKVAPVNNCNFVKPEGGVWLSPFTEKGTAWVDWMVGAEWSPHKPGSAIETTEVHLRPDAKVLRIDSLADLQKTYETYPNYNEVFDMVFQTLDFESISQDWDAIYLTQEGQWETHRSSPLNLYGWDLESMVVLNKDALQVDS